MNQREKNLLAVVLSLVGIFAVGGLIYVAFFRAMDNVERETNRLRSQLDKLRQERREFFDAETGLQEVARRTFSDRPDLASAKSSEMLTRLIQQSGLSETDVTRLPLGPRRLRGAQEIGWMIQAQGPMAQLINFLFLLENTPYIHRIESLTVSSASQPGRGKVSFRWLTLVIDPAPDVEFRDLAFAADLQGRERQRYAVITERNLLEPHQPPPPAPPAPDPPPSTPPGPGPENFRVVSLSQWKGQEEVHVLDLSQNTTRRLQPGDNLAGGTIVMIDYRPFPKPGKEYLKSNSRVIIRRENDFWAVEEGDSLARIYKLTSEKIPAELVKN